ncbi:MAG: enamine deaminase RidA (YjgF/YER057c/UK114 family) [Saprospiraceae bacterium]|jgi:enamine deaminase RidA (YjgF/YER057c/UK114 family)
MSKKRELYSSGAEWEEIAGYSRAVRVGDRIEVSGTTAMVGGLLVGKGDIYLQTRTVLQIIKKAIEELDGDIKDVVRTKMYVTDISQWESVAKAHGEMFSQIRPASTMVEVSALIDPDLMVEIEASVIIS